MSVSGEWFSPKNLEFQKIKARGPTEWTTFSLSDSMGITGQGEITFTQLSRSVAPVVARLANKLRGNRITSDYDVLTLNNLTDINLKENILLASAVSGLRCAVTDALARASNLSMASYIRALGGEKTNHPSKITLYANINRSMLPDDNGVRDRSPESFAKTATKAEQEGFKTIKCAPFDECTPPYEKSGIPREADLGINRISAIKEQLKLETKLYVDCHSRFDEQSAFDLGNILASMGVGWYEEPVDPIKETNLTKTIRKNCSIPLAGGEMGYGLELFVSLIQEQILDVVMPDIKFCGGPVEAYHIGRELENLKLGTVSMHCPSGPISLLASAHCTAAFGNFLPLEHAVYENDWRHEILEPSEFVRDGFIHLPEGYGLGAHLDQATIATKGVKWTE
jgi:galactonate dehydratase